MTKISNKVVRPWAFITFECLKIPIKHEARVFETASQSGPNCKQRKKRQEKKVKIAEACEFCLLLLSQRTVRDDNVRAFHNWGLFISNSHNLHSLASCYFRNIDGLAEDEFFWARPAKSVQEDSLLVQSKPKSTWYKDKCGVEVFRTWQVAREPKFCIPYPGSMFKEEICYGTATTASALFFFYFGVKLHHSAVAGSRLSLLCRRRQTTPSIL